MIKDEFGNRRFFGVYRGVIAEVNDPNSQKRVKLSIPQVFGNVTTDWAWPAEAYLTPKIGQGVFVLFEGGDPSYPVYFGMFGEGVPGIPDPTMDAGVVS